MTWEIIGTEHLMSQPQYHLHEGNVTAQRLTVMGDRQAGKSYLATMYAATEGCMGHQVLYESWNGHECRCRLRDCLEMLAALGLKYASARQSNGNLSITFSNGGSVRFIPTGTWANHRYDCDVHILDEGSDLVHPGAKRILRTALR